MKNQTNQSEICQYCNLSDCECSDQEDWDSCDSPKPKTLYSFKEINLQNKSLLAEIRIICKNLIYVIGLAPNIAKEDQLKKMEYFGQYGQIQKLIVIQSNTFNPPSHAAYITYRNEQEASLAILVNIINIYLFWHVKNFPYTTDKQRPPSEPPNIAQTSQRASNVRSRIVYTCINTPRTKTLHKCQKKYEEMNNSKWLFSYSQKLAQANFKKFYTKINYKNALQKSVFPTTQNILDNMIQAIYTLSDYLLLVGINLSENSRSFPMFAVKERVVEPIQQQQQQINLQWEEIKETQQQQEFPQPIQQKPIDIEKRVEAVILKMDGEGNRNSRFKFTNSENVPQDYEAIQQIKQYLQK